MYSITIKIYPSSYNISNIFAILGLFNFFIKSGSFKIFFILSPFALNDFLLNDLIATPHTVNIFKPMLTFLKAP